ncbi:Glycosyl hydrolases family 32 (levanase/invertase) [Halalkaliarchaeum sp. AArc-CO]|uniref:GH32 C-terminal domain-containing protein n=1 Tax=unclassified Halalkaliarchaeum TaxID=2678344 RepID=UPI00217E94C1|nr:MULTISPECIES: GH32 C-terminal domain-containing protein [unclassified Halalkaliarchaeum]MDR5672966.1 GH32 C-terminal domain-containing protein [Halalkaliarchaeum sp. AArc-GB]UWG50309.1 Glycosyl hydrolases family 32 (levanase/invertase) [Halalkaliarchaeum sp. AArc-CO]
MDTSDAAVGFLAVGELDTEERAALTWCRTEFDTERIELDAVSDGDRLAGLDVIWWHANEPIATPREIADCAPAFQSFLEDGGGLLLTSRAVAQVSALGIDPVPPDATGTEPVEEPTGVLWKSVYADHPILAGLTGLRHHTQPAGDPAPYARYENVLPERADVLAGTVRGETDVPSELGGLQWRVGEGTVVGIGQGMAFSGADAEDTEASRERIVKNGLQFLAGDATFDLTAGRPVDAAGLLDHRRELDDDPHRPHYHVCPPANWLNDPNGCIRWNDRYHVFYQYNPGGPHHDTIHWGHAVSDDLLHWEDRSVALSPTPSGPDRDGCWSGCAVDDDGTARIVYTGGRDRWQLPCLATAADGELSTWVPDDDNPVIEQPPSELDLLSTEHWHAEFRDHAIWQADGYWYQLIGAGLEDVGGTVILYKSSDLRNWEYLGPVLVGDWETPGTVWECPELLELDDSHLLHVSNYETVLYFLGEFDADAGQFRESRRGTLDPGDFYAPQSLHDGDRTVTFGWIPEARGISRQWDAGWAGTLSVPRELSVERNRLHQRPIREFSELRERRLCRGRVDLDDETRRLDAAGRSIEIEATLEVGDASEVGFLVCATPDGAEQTRIRYDSESVTIDRKHSSLDPGANRAPQSVAVDDLESPLDVRVFVDGSVVELFAGERRALTSRIYPTRHDSTGVAAYAVDGDGSVDATIWAMGSAWPDVANFSRGTEPKKASVPSPDGK